MVNKKKTTEKTEVSTVVPTQIGAEIGKDKKEPQVQTREPGGFRSRKRFGKYEKEQSEFDQKLLDVRRTARMVAGGRRFSFRAVVIIGNKKGKVGAGIAKGADVTMAIDKAVRQANKYLVEIPITEDGSIAYRVEAKYSAAKVMLKPAAKGRGIIAGGTIRTVCDLAGIKNITAKAIGRTANKLSNARAAILALSKLL